MRLWIINHYAYTPADAAGTRHYSIAKRLIARGHEVSIVASSFYHKGHRERLTGGERYRKQLVDGVPFTWIRSPAYSGNTLGRFWNMVVFAFRVWRGVGLRGKSRPDVILGSSPDLFSAFAACRLAQRYRIPFVLEIHDLWPDTLVEIGGFGRRHPLVWLLERLERYLYGNADWIVSALPAAAERMVNKGADPTRVEWIPNGVDLDMVPEPNPPRKSGRFVAMYVGAHNLANSLDCLLDAAEILEREGWGDRVSIRLVGDGVDKPRLRRKAEALGLGMVEFLEPVPKTDVYVLMQDADVLVSTWKNSPLYRWGISPNKIPDYMASARPVILSVATPASAVGQADAGLVIPPEDAHAMAHAIRKMASLTGQERWQMGKRGREHVARFYAYDVLAGRLEQVISALVPTGVTKGN